jgi:hypothetical protein
MPAFFLSLPGLLAAAGLAALVIHDTVRRREGGQALASGRVRAATLATRIVISLVVLAAALYVILARPDAADDHKWAYSIIGTIVGYWLKSAS